MLRGAVDYLQEKRIRAEVDSLEKDKGIKVRVLAQNYPETPGLAIRDYWKVDEDVSFVCAHLGDQAMHLLLAAVLWSEASQILMQTEFSKQ